MKLSIFWKAVALTLALGSVAAIADPVWQEYRSAKGGYRIEMPGKPDESERDLPSSPGLKLYAATLKYEKGAMIAVASDIKPQPDPEKILDNSRDLAMKTMQGTISSEKKEKVGKYPARRVDYSGPNGLSGTTRFVVTDHLFYQIEAIGSDGFGATPEAKRFLNSFAIIGK